MEIGKLTGCPIRCEATSKLSADSHLPVHRRREPKTRTLYVSRKGRGTLKITPPEKVSHSLLILKFVASRVEFLDLLGGRASARPKRSFFQSALAAEVEFGCGSAAQCLSVRWIDLSSVFPFHSHGSTDYQLESFCLFFVPAEMTVPSETRGSPYISQ